MASDRAVRAEVVRLRIIEMAETQEAAIKARQAKIQEHLSLGHCVKVIDEMVHQMMLPPLAPSLAIQEHLLQVWHVA